MNLINLIKEGITKPEIKEARTLRKIIDSAKRFNAGNLRREAYLRSKATEKQDKKIWGEK